MTAFSGRVRRLAAIGVSLALCAVAAGCGNYGLVDADEKQPPDVDTIWQLDIKAGTADPVPVQAVADGDELFVWGHVGQVADVGGRGVAAFALATGEKLWEAKGDVRNVWIAQDAVVVEGQSGKVQVLDRASGKLRFKLEAAMRASPVAATFDGVAVLEEAADGFDLVFYDLDSGDELWRGGIEDSASAEDVHVSAPSKAASVERLSTEATPENMHVVQDSPLVYVYMNDSAGSKYYAPYAVADGKRHDKIEITDSPEVAPGGFMTVTDEGNSVTLVGREQCDIVYAIVGEDLSESDRFDMSGGPRCRKDPPGTGEMYVDDMVYTVDFSGHPQLFDADTGEIVWTGPERGKAFTFADGIATYGRRGIAKAVDVESGEQLWDWDYEAMEPRDGYLNFSAYGSDNRYATSRNTVFLGDERSTFAVNAKNGEPVWSHPGAILDFSGNYVVLGRDLDRSEQQLQVSKIDGG